MENFCEKREECSLKKMLVAIEEKLKFSKQVGSDVGKEIMHLSCVVINCKKVSKFIDM